MTTSLEPVATQEITADTERLFIGLPVPERVSELLASTFALYPQYIETQIPRTNWHLTLAWLGDVANPKQYYSRLLKPLPQSFVPTVQLTHVGRGRPTRQLLWAFAEPTPVLLGLREQMVKRLKKMRFQFPKGEPQKEYMPHVTLANLFPQVGHVGIADAPTVTSFTVESINLYRSRTLNQRSTHDVVDSISLVASRK